MSNQQKKGSFYGGAAILSIGVILTKMIGALYKIPLGNILANATFSDYDTAYRIYNFFLTIGTAGLPIALSKSIAEAHTHNRNNQVRKLFQVALGTFFVFGLISMCAMLTFADQFAILLGNEKAANCIRAIAPSAFFVCVLSAFRGTFQGHGNMVPTSVSQIVESAFKLIAGIGLSLALIHLGYGQGGGAVGATLGVTVGSIAALICLLFYFMRWSKRQNHALTDRADSSSALLKQLLVLAIPITISSAANNIVSLIDNRLVMTQLRTMYENMGMTTAAALDGARALNGIYGKVLSIYNLPFALMIPITASVIPAVSSSLSTKNHRAAGSISESSLRMGFLLACPAGIGLAVLAEPIVKLLYPKVLTPDEAVIGGNLLCTLGIASIIVCITLICNSILQAHGRLKLPIIGVVVGGAAKIFVNYTLVGIPEINIQGAPVGTLCCFTVIAIIELSALKIVMPHSPKYLKIFPKIALAGIIMGAGAWGTYGLCYRFLSSNTLATFGAILVAVVIYAVLIVAFKVFTLEDMKLMPKGDKIAKILRIS